MMETPQKTEIQLRLLKVQETGYLINSGVLDTISKIDASKIAIEFGVRLDFKKERDQLVLHLSIKYAYPIENKMKSVVELTTANHFEIKGLKEIIEVKEDEFKDSKGILPTLLGVAIGTIRGILVVKTSGTILTDFPLPIMNPTELCLNIKKTKV